MPEASTTNIRATTRPIAGNPDAGRIDALKKTYDDLAKKTTEASQVNDLAALGKLKVEKQKAFTEWKTASDAAAKAGGKKAGAIDPGSPIVAL